jgi:hypothetical protein
LGKRLDHDGPSAGFGRSGLGSSGLVNYHGEGGMSATAAESDSGSDRKNRGSYDGAHRHAGSKEGAF